MKKEKINYLFCLLFFLLFAAVTFRCVLGKDMVFSASDVNIGGLALRHRIGWPLLSGYFRSVSVLGSANHSFSLFNILAILIDPAVFANIFYPMVLVFGSLSMVWFLRIWDRSWLASVLGAIVAFWVNSIMLATGGHVYKMEVLAFSVLSLALIEKSVRALSARRSIGFALLAGLSVGIMMIEQQDVAILAGLFVGAYAFFRLFQLHQKSFLRWLTLLIPIALVSLPLSAPTLLKSYEDNIVHASQVQSGEQQKWDYVTQWSMVPSEWPDLIALGWSGWSTGNPKGPYWGKIGQSAEWETTKQGFQNFKLTSSYFGIIPFLLGFFGLLYAFKQRKTEEGATMLFWGVASFFAFWLAFGRYSLIYKLFFHIPLFGNIRAPIKFLDNFQIMLAILVAYGFDALFFSKSDEVENRKTLKKYWITAGVIMVLTLLAGLRYSLAPASQVVTFTQMGLGKYADLLVGLMAKAWFHAAFFSFFAMLLGFLAWKGSARKKQILALGFLILLTGDSLLMTSHYFKASSVASLKKGNMVLNYLKDHQGSGRTYLVDQGGMYNQWLASDAPYHGVNIFNIWQMNRMPVEYKEFLGKVGRNPLRLWQLSAINHIAAPAQVLAQFQQNPVLAKQFKTVLRYQIPTQRGMRPDVLLEYTGGIPRFALFQNWKAVPLENQCDLLASPAHHPETTVLVEPEAKISARSKSVSSAFKPETAKISKTKATLEVQADESSLLRFAQRFQSGWTVWVDGNPAQLLRLDYLCMGVEIPEGIHQVEFRAPSAKNAFYFSLSILFFALLLASFFLFSKEKPREEI